MSAKKAKTARRGVARIEAARPAQVQSKSWPLFTMHVLAALGLGVSIYLTVLHLQAGPSGTIESPFCGTSSTINCNTVLGSPYARLFGLPVAGWAALTYAAIFLASFLPHVGLAVLLCGWAFTFSLYMASLSLFVIKSACVFCMTLYIINIGLFIGAIALARSATSLTGGQTVYSAVGYAIVVAGFAWWQAQSIPPPVPPVPVGALPPTALPPAAIDPEFMRYYAARPQVSLKSAERHTKGPVQATLTISEFVDFR